MDTHANPAAAAAAGAAADLTSVSDVCADPARPVDEEISTDTLAQPINRSNRYATAVETGMTLAAQPVPFANLEKPDLDVDHSQPLDEEMTGVSNDERDQREQSNKICQTHVDVANTADGAHITLTGEAIAHADPTQPLLRDVEVSSGDSEDDTGEPTQQLDFDDNSKSQSTSIERVKAAGVEKSDDDDDDDEQEEQPQQGEEARRAVVAAQWLDAKLPTLDLETTNLKQLRVWMIATCPEASHITDLKKLIKQHVTEFVSIQPSPESSDADSSDDNSNDTSDGDSSDSNGESEKQKRRGAQTQKKKADKRISKQGSSSSSRSAKLDSDASSSDSDSDASSSSSCDNNEPSHVVSKRNKKSNKKRIVKRSSKPSAVAGTQHHRRNKRQPRQRKTRAPSTRRARKTTSATRNSHGGPMLDAHESFVKEMATTEFVRAGIDALGLDHKVLGPSVQGKDDDFVTPEWNKLCLDATATLNSLAWSLRSTSVPADQVARISRAIFDQMPMRETPNDGNEEEAEIITPMLDESGKVKSIAHALESLDLQARMYKALLGSAAPSDWNNRTVKYLYHNVLAFKLSDARPGVAKLVREELCGSFAEKVENGGVNLDSTARNVLKVTKCLQVTRGGDEAAFQPFRTGLGNVRMLWMPVEAVSLLHVLQNGPTPPSNTSAVSQYSGLELFSCGAGALDESREHSLAHPRKLYFILVEAACGEGVDTDDAEHGDEWPVCADSLWTAGEIATEDVGGQHQQQHKPSAFDGDDTDGAWKSWKFEKRDVDDDSGGEACEAGDVEEGGEGDDGEATECSIWRRGSSNSRMTSGTRVSVFDHGQVAIRFLVEVTAI